MNRQFAGACPSSVFGGEDDTQMDFEMDSPSAYFQAQPSQRIPHDQSGYVEQNSYGELALLSWPTGMMCDLILTLFLAFRFPIPEQYQEVGWDYPMHRSHQRQHSTSTQSTTSSFIRSSNGSAFS